MKRFVWCTLALLGLAAFCSASADAAPFVGGFRGGLGIYRALLGGGRGVLGARGVGNLGLARRGALAARPVVGVGRGGVVLNRGQFIANRFANNRFAHNRGFFGNGFGNAFGFINPLIGGLGYGGLGYGGAGFNSLGFAGAGLGGCGGVGAAGLGLADTSLGNAGLAPAIATPAIGACGAGLGASALGFNGVGAAGLGYSAASLGALAVPVPFPIQTVVVIHRGFNHFGHFNNFNRFGHGFGGRGFRR